MKNANADALSRNPAAVVGVVEVEVADSAGGTGVVASESDGVLSEAEETGVEVGTSGEVVSEQGDAAEESGEAGRSVEVEDGAIAELTPEKLLEIRDLQQQDPSLAWMCRFLEHGQLSDGEQESKRLVLESWNYEVIQGILHYEPLTVPGRLCVVVPEALRVPLLQEARAMNLAGHFAFRWVYDKIRRHYWWKWLRSDVHKFCRSCLVCTNRRGPGRPLHTNSSGRSIPQGWSRCAAAPTHPEL